MIKEIKKTIHAMGLIPTLWALFWFPFAVFFLLGFATVVAITNFSIELGIEAFKEAL